MAKENSAYYQQAGDQVLQILTVDPDRGLDNDEIARRQERYGLNRLEQHRRISPLQIFLSQFKDVLIIVLLVAAAVSLLLAIVSGEGSLKEGLLILAIVVAIAITGFFNEYKAEKTVEALRKLVGHMAMVRRSGARREIAVEQLVPGDIVLLSEGQKVPADLRLLEAKSLHINEASLTGESLPVKKQSDVIGNTAALGDQLNMAFSGTLITTGSGYGVVTATAHRTELGKIADLVEAEEDDLTPMQKKLDALGKQLGWGVLAIAAVVFAVVFGFDEAIQSDSDAEKTILAFTAAVALAVAAIPEGLAFVVRISLALGARRMAARNALVRKLSAVEALGSTDVICSDKTGTLTRGEMTVRRLWAGRQTISLSGSGYETSGEFSIDGQKTDSSAFTNLLRCGALCNDAGLKDDGSILGDPTEAALLVSAAKAGLELEELDKTWHRIDSLPFSSERKRMSTLLRAAGGYTAYIKGSPEVVLERCTLIEINGKAQKLTPTLRRDILAANHDFAAQALRVLGFASKTLDGPSSEEKQLETGLTFLGLQGMMDPPRTEIKAVIEQISHTSGVRTVMITGDYVETAKAVAREIGIEGKAISGPELDELSEAEFVRIAPDIAIYARVNPEHKIRIVKALQAHGHQVAMTGDGVNDAPAIKAADIGIAMGITGTDVSKEAADLILLDDKYPTIVAAIEEGRGIFDNVRKFVNYLLSANIAEVITVLFGVLIYQNLVLTAAQLLFINIVTDGLPAIALGSDPSEKGIMRFRPQRFQRTIVDKRVWIEMLVFGSLMSVALLVHYGVVLDSLGSQYAQSVAFAGMVVYEMMRLIDIRSDYKIRWFSNPWLSVAIAGSFALLAAVLYLEPVAELFQLQGIGAFDWGIIIAVSLGLLVFMKLLNPLLDRLMPGIPSS